MFAINQGGWNKARRRSEATAKRVMTTEDYIRQPGSPSRQPRQAGHEKGGAGLIGVFIPPPSKQSCPGGEGGVY